ncbi:MAG: hypothetical protein ACRBG0_02110 [Lewinella sp.]|jgi:hypothetical protein|uniref:hypothetical protein n=1 Tax=Lewinella TaxID=70994 RepID=UPI00038197B0|nr:hypothetical protein [Lewinella cohaerens]
MRILSVFSHGNEIAIRNTILGKEKVFYNDREVSGKYSFFGATHTFEIQEGPDWVEYIVKVGYNNLGVSANVWRNGEMLVRGLASSCASPIPPKRQTNRPQDTTNYHHDLV